tara:strand:- start:971 stop:1678 length:708 start_codon:yes stop_codon:yes gene_type:complete
MSTLRIQYVKKDSMKFLSHLEMVRFMERAFRRMELPLKFSQGFNPHPKISFAAPLAVGVSSEAEIVEVELTEAIDLNAFIKNHSDNVPAGLSFVRAKEVSGSGKLMALVCASEYLVEVRYKDSAPGSEHRNEMESLTQLLDKEEIMIQKKTKKGKIKDVNIRPFVIDAKYVLSEGDRSIYRLTVATGSNGNLKPEVFVDSLMKEMGLEASVEALRVHRLELFTQKEGKMMPLYDI